MDWLLSPPKDIVTIFLTGLIIYLLTILLTRLYGLRSFSKMSSFDFAMTVAIGSLIASTVVNPDRTAMQGAVALAALYTLQYMVAHLRRKVSSVDKIFDNRPILLMQQGEMLKENMAKAQVTEDDLVAKLREANVIRMSQVLAVVMETTGDISVLHSDKDDQQLEEYLLRGVRD